MRSPVAMAAVSAAVAAAVGIAVNVAGGSAVMAETAAVKGLIRVDQVGYGAGEAKHAYFMTGSGTAPGFTVVDAQGKTVLSAAAGPDRGSWNARYPHVYDLDFGALTTRGA